MSNNAILLIANPDTLGELKKLRIDFRKIRIIPRFSIPRDIIIISNGIIIQEDITYQKDVLEYANKLLSQGYDAVLIKVRPRATCKRFLNKVKHYLSLVLSKILSLFIPDVCKSDEFLFEIIAFRHESFKKLLSCCLAIPSTLLSTDLVNITLLQSGLRICRLNINLNISDEFYDRLTFRDILTKVLEMLKESGYRPLKFALVGSSGVIVNEGLLFLLHGMLGLPVFLAGLIAIETSIVNNFSLHEIWTFKKKILSRDFKSKICRFGKYHIAVGIGALVNYIVLVLLNMAFGMSYDANLIGIALGFLANYLISDRFVWKRKKNTSGQ